MVSRSRPSRRPKRQKRENDQHRAAGKTVSEKERGHRDQQAQHESGAPKLNGGFQNRLLKDVAVKALHLEDDGAERHQDEEHPPEIVEIRDDLHGIERQRQGGADDMRRPECDHEEGAVQNLLKLEIELLFASDHASWDSE